MSQQTNSPAGIPVTQITTASQLAAYYTNLLVIQYKSLPNATGTISALALEVAANLIYNQVLNGFDLTTAIGDQLNILGNYVGAQRTVFGFAPGVTFFSLAGYSDTVPGGFGGLSDYSVSDPSVYWDSYFSTPTSFVLSDGLMRQLIQYLIALHMSDTSNQSIDLILQAFFGGFTTLTDGENMSITFTHDTTDPNVLFELVNYLGLLPHPAGVQIIVVEV